ncbi:TRDMT methyltransferase, partial [Prunella fulvescens]|nr:TRDMT methyltransferase [Prunella fulvescens]
FQGITLKEFDRLSFDMILMSPPCQPFTRIGLQGDVSDPRTKSFLYILDILPRLCEGSNIFLIPFRNELLQTLATCGFKYQEFLLSPTCLGIPNSRLRYFLIAKLHQEPFSFQAPGQVSLFTLMVCVDEWRRMSDSNRKIPRSGSRRFTQGKNCSSKESLPKGSFLFKLETVEEMERKRNQDNDSSIQMLKDFLEEENEEMSQYFLPPKSLLRYALLLDIVTPTCRRSTCFTKGYGHYVEGTGSVLQTAVDVQVSTKKSEQTQTSDVALYVFVLGFPEKVTVKQCYRLLGNSLNVHVVAKLISILLE